MIRQARIETERMKLDNILIVEGNAEDLPYADGLLGMVVSRLATHHFESPSAQLREMIRVCKPGQIVGTIDLLSPEDERVAETYNHLERLRDPSHTIALSKTEMERLLKDSGLAVKTRNTQNVEADFQRWFEMTGTDPETKEYIRNRLWEDIHDGIKTGMRPFMKDGSLKFLQTWLAVLGTK